MPDEFRSFQISAINEPESHTSIARCAIRTPGTWTLSFASVPRALFPTSCPEVNSWQNSEQWSYSEIPIQNSPPPTHGRGETRLARTFEMLRTADRIPKQ